MATRGVAVSPLTAAWIDACLDMASTHLAAHAPTGRFHHKSVEWTLAFPRTRAEAEDWDARMVHIRDDAVVRMWASLAAAFPDRVRFRAETIPLCRDFILLSVVLSADWGDENFVAPAPPRPADTRTECHRWWASPGGSQSQASASDAYEKSKLALGGVR